MPTILTWNQETQEARYLSNKMKPESSNQFAGIIGVLAGVWTLVGVDALLGDADTGSFKHPEINLITVLVALTVLIVSGALAGLIPAQRAVKIKPIEALRDE